MPTWDLLLTGARMATMAADAGPWGLVEDGAIAIADGRIDWVGPCAELPGGTPASTRDLGGAWVTPALIDCHTHLVFAGNRAAEFELRLKGASYEEIAAAGGGILSTVRATRSAGRDALVAAASERLLALRGEGVATVEIKSGYGLDLDTELRMLDAARSLGQSLGVSVTTTFLGAHALPPEFSNRRDEYIDALIDEILPAAVASGLADSVDAYCERIAFSADEVAKVFERALELGLPVRLHADQLSDSGGAELAASYAALSADHLEYASDRGVRALAASGTVAVLLPGAFVTLREKQLPPVAGLREHGVPIAVATDCNPGTSPLCSLRTAMSLAATQFRLTPEECLAGVTRAAAQALGLPDRGTLEAGKRADIAVWDIGHPAELAYWIGLNQLRDLYVAGVVMSSQH